MWWYDRGSQRPVDSRNEPLCSGAHAQGAAQPGGAYCGLLARQPGIARPDHKAAHHAESTLNVLYRERPWPKWTGTRYCTSLHTGLNPGPKAFRTVVDPAGLRLSWPGGNWSRSCHVPRQTALTNTLLCSYGHVVFTPAGENGTATVNRRSVLYSSHQAVVESRAVFRWMHRCG